MHVAYGPTPRKSLFMNNHRSHSVTIRHVRGNLPILASTAYASQRVYTRYPVRPEIFIPHLRQNCPPCVCPKGGRVEACTKTILAHLGSNNYLMEWAPRGPRFRRDTRARRPCLTSGSKWFTMATSSRISSGAPHNFLYETVTVSRGLTER